MEHVSPAAIKVVRGVEGYLQRRAVVGDAMIGDLLSAVLLATEAGRLAEIYKVVSDWVIASGVMEEEGVGGE